MTSFLATVRRWSIFISDENDVPVATGPLLHVSVSREELLLRSGDDLARDLAVGHESTRAITSLEETQVTFDLKTTDR